MNLADLERDYQRSLKVPAAGGSGLLDDFERDYQASLKSVPPSPAPAAAPTGSAAGAAPPSSSGGRFAGVAEDDFRRWYGQWAERAGINPDPDDPRHKYDYRMAYAMGAEPMVDPSDGRYHWPSQFKSDDHPNRFVDGVDTKSGDFAARGGDEISTITNRPVAPRVYGGKGSGDKLLEKVFGRPYADTHDRWGPNVLGYSKDAEGLKQAGADVGKAVAHVAGAPARVALSLNDLMMTIAGYPISRAMNLLPVKDDQGRKTGDIFLGENLAQSKELRDRLTFVDEPFSDMALSAAMGGAAGAYMRWLREGGKIGRYGASLLRSAGVTEPMITTAAKSAVSAVAGDKILADPAIAAIDRYMSQSDLSPGTKQAVASVAPLLIGLVSGATIEARIDRMLKNPMALGFMESMGRAELTPKQIVEKFKAAIDEDVEQKGIGRLAQAERSIADGGQQKSDIKGEISEKAGELAEGQFEEQVQGGMSADDIYRMIGRAPGAPPSKSAKDSAAVFNAEASQRARDDVAEIERLMVQPSDMGGVIDRSVDASTGKSAEQSARDMITGQEVALNDIYRRRIPEARRMVAQQPGLTSVVGEATAGRAPSAEAGQEALRRYKLDEIAQASGGRELSTMGKDELIRARMQFKHAGRDDLLDLVNERFERIKTDEAQQRVKALNKQASGGGETLRWRIDQEGGIDFGNFQGEARDIPPMVRRSISRKDGRSIDLVERTLKNEGWLDDDEDLLELLKYDPQILRRRHLGTDIADRKTHLTDKERRLKEQLAYEPEAPEGLDDLPGWLQADVASGRIGMEEARAMADEPFTLFETGGSYGNIEADAKGGRWHEIEEQAPRQQEFDFEFKEVAPEKTAHSNSVPETLPDAQRVRMATTGRLRAGSATVRDAGEVASLLAHIRKSAQENFYTVAVDGDGNVLEVHRFSKGLRASAPVSATTVAGRVMNIGPDVKKVYFVHNHPSTSGVPSRDDDEIHRLLGSIVGLKDIDHEALVIAGTKYRNISLDHARRGYEDVPIPPSSRSMDIPVKERYVSGGAPKDRMDITSPKDAQFFIDKHYPGKEGFLFLDNKHRPVGWMDYPKGKKMADAAADVVARSEGLNSGAVIFKSSGPLDDFENRGQFIRKMQHALGEDVKMLDVIEGDTSRMTAGTMEVMSRSTGGQATAYQQLNRRDSESTLYMHPSTITGPIGGIASGVDWGEYEKTGDVKFDPKRALIGAIAGVVAPGAARRMRNLGHNIAEKWDAKFAEPFIEAVKRQGRRLPILADMVPGVSKHVDSEDIEFALGLHRSEAFGDMMRNYRRDVERSWGEAARFGQELAEIAPTQLEQRRLMQIMRGGVTANPVWAKKAEQARDIFKNLRQSLGDYDLLEYSRFDGVSRKQRAKLREIIARSKVDRQMDEAAFLEAYGLNKSGFDQEFVDDGPKQSIHAGGRGDEPPAHATEEIPLKSYGGGDSEPMKTPAQWAREKLHDHYHFATAEEYMPLYYAKHEGLTPKQREAIEDELRRLRIRSRRVDPEGDPVIERQIAEVEKLLNGGWQGRRELKKARTKLALKYAHRRMDIPYEVQKLMGVIEEAPFPVAKGVGVQQSDVVKGRLFEEINNNAEWVFHTKIKDPKTGEMRQVYGGEPPANFVKVEGKQWGALDGNYVRRDIWDDLREVDEWRNAFTRLWDKTLGAWKYGKVVLNPATHARNIMSNLILAYMGDVSPADLKTWGKAARSVTRGVDDVFYKEADDWGLFNDTFVSSEIPRLRDELEALRDPKSLKNWIRKAAALPAEVYQGNEKLAKLAVFIKAREAGASVDDAARKAEKFLFNYADIPPWVKSMRRWVSPFFVFTYKALPLFAEMAVRKPHKVAAIAGAMYGMEEYARRSLGMSGEDYEEQRDMLPEWQNRRIFGVGPHTQVLMPFRDKWGNNLYFDLAYILPFGNAGEKWGQSALPFSDFMPSNPLFQIGAEVLTNHDAFTGNEIYNEVLDGAGQVAAKYMEHAWRELAPSMAPGGYGWNKLKTGLQNSLFGKDVRDWADRPIELSTAVMSSLFGIKLTPAAERQLKAFELRKREDIAREVGKEVGRLRVKRRRNEVDEEEFGRAVGNLEELKRKLLEREK